MLHCQPIYQERTTLRWIGRAILILAFILFTLISHGQAADSNYPRLETVENKVSLRRGGQTRTVENPQPLFPEDWIITGENSRATIALGPRRVERLGELSEFQIISQESDGETGIMASLVKGVLFLFSRDEPGTTQFRTPHTIGASKGTDFVIKVTETVTEVVVLSGSVSLTNQLSGLGIDVQRDQVGQVDANEAGPPRVQPRLVTTADVQWFLYYPAVLDADSLNLGEADQEALEDSLAAYRRGNLPQAIRLLPPNFQAESQDARSLHAALLLVTGQVEASRDLLRDIPMDVGSAHAVRWLMHAVLDPVDPSGFEPDSSGEWLALSYLRQRHLDPVRKTRDLKGALSAARRSLELSEGQFAFAGVRVAELLFGEGNTKEAMRELDRALQLSPENAQALALKGFLLAAQNRLSPAAEAFDRAIAIDPALGNARLGSALVKIRRGRRWDYAEAYAEILLATALEPDRSLLHSYLGKALSDAMENLWSSPKDRDFYREEAEKELELAKRLDPEDPTPWLYDALHQFKQNRINSSIRQLQESKARNDNRAVFRSDSLLDQDQAVRSHGLAKLYRAAGLTERSIQEATRAVDQDYANAAAHLFLAESWNERRDPTRFNLRFETAWFNELLLANMLSPIGAGALSQNVSQQEYSRLFESQNHGFSTSTYLDDQEVYRQSASQYGLMETTSYALDFDYQNNQGIRRNNDLSRLEFYTTVKQQIAPQHDLFLLTKYEDYESGDNFQYYDPSDASPDFRFKEKQDPLVFLGYHREWAPGNHTLIGGARLVNRQDVTQGDTSNWRLESTAPGSVFSVLPVQFDSFSYDSEFEALSLELNQVLQKPNHTFVLGTRVQGGDFDTKNQFGTPIGFPPLLFYEPGALSSSADEDFERVSAYFYHYLKLIPDLTLTYGMTYDWLSYPSNFKLPPVNSGTDDISQWSPKAALRWDASEEIAFRGIYSEAVGGVTFDESFRLEPTQLAGFPQAFRSIISESEVGSVAGPTYEFAGAGIDWNPTPDWFFTLQAGRMQSDVRNDLGAFQTVISAPPNTSNTSVREKLDYQEDQIGIHFSKIIGQHWVAGGHYQFSNADLDRNYPTLRGVTNDPNRREKARLQKAGLFAGFNHGSGFFAKVNGDYYRQTNHGYGSTIYASERPGDEFFQFDWHIGYRLLQQRVEIRVGMMNFTDQDYRLNPLVVTRELPRSRTSYFQLSANF